MNSDSNLEHKLKSLLYSITNPKFNPNRNTNLNPYSLFIKKQMKNGRMNIPYLHIIFVNVKFSSENRHYLDVFN